MPTNLGSGDTLRQFDLLGVPIGALSLNAAVKRVMDLSTRLHATSRAAYVCVRDVNGIVACQRDPRLRQVHAEADLVTPDGMPVVWWGRWHGYHETERVYGPDLMAAVCRSSAQRDVRHFLCGGEEGVAEELKRRLERRYPGLAIVGTHTPPFRPLREAEMAALARRITASGAAIVWIGLSSPKQEWLMAQLAPRLRGGVLIGVGAAFDFLSGRKAQAPRWLQRTGFEWLFRLATEPRRLWRRYLVNNSVFLALAARQLLRGKQRTAVAAATILPSGSAASKRNDRKEQAAAGGWGEADAHQL